MLDNSLKMKVTSNLIWRFLERFGAQFVTFIVSIVLARILDPTAYGTVSLVTVFTAILTVFIDSGMGNALIQKKDADELDYSTLFYFNIFMCAFLYIIMFVFAPVIAGFYGRKELTKMIRVLSLTLVIAGVKNIQQAYVAKNLIFKKFFFATIGGTVFSALLGIVLACMGYGVWAIIWQQLSNSAIDTVILWATVKWRPKRAFSLNRLKALFNYGWKLLVSSLTETVYNNLRHLIIGRMYTAEDLAYYNKGESFPKLIVENINTSISSVLFPVMSNAQDDIPLVKSMTRRAIRVSMFVMAPMMVGLGICAEPLIRIILTDKWIFCVPYMRIFCFQYAFWPVHTANLSAIKALGRSDIYLKLELLKKVVGLVVLGISMWFGVLGIAYGLIVISVLGQIINSWPNKKLLSYPYREQLKDIFPILLMSIIMGVFVSLLSLLNLNSVVLLLLQIFTGVIVYWGESKLLKIEELNFIQSILNKIIKR